MTQIKRVPFDYEYFKQHPETKLETKRGKVAYLIGKKKIKHEYPLIFESETMFFFSTTLNGIYDTNDNNDYLDIFMLLESKEEVGYTNIYDDWVGASCANLEEAIDRHVDNARSVAKLTIVDGEIVKCKTVHKY